jgi:hypothetical protein
MFEFLSMLGHWLHLAICTLGYITFAVIVFALIDELHAWLTRGMSARPIPKGQTDGGQAPHIVQDAVGPPPAQR